MTDEKSYTVTCPRCDQRNEVMAQRVDTGVDDMPRYVGTTTCEGCRTRLNVKDYREDDSAVRTGTGLHIVNFEFHREDT